MAQESHVPGKPRVPPELFPLIVDRVAENDLATQSYGLAEETKGSLKALCLTSIALRAHADPLLWRTVRVESCSEINQVLNCSSTRAYDDTKASRLVHLRRIYIGLTTQESASPPNCLLRLMALLAQDAKHLQALAFDIPFRECTSKVWKAFNAQFRPLFRQLPLRELVSLRDEVFFSMPWGAATPRRGEWQYFEALQRLVIYNPVLEDDFVLAVLSMPHLRDVVIMRSDYGWVDGDEKEGKAILALQKACRTQEDGSRKTLRLFVSGGYGSHLLRSGMILRALSELERDADSGFTLHLSVNLDGVPHKMEAADVSPFVYQDWIRTSIQNGALWKAKGHLE